MAHRCLRVVGEASEVARVHTQLLYLRDMVVVIKRGMSKQRIQMQLRKLRAQRTKARKPVDVYKYVGVLKLDEDPVALQRKWRDEW